MLGREGLEMACIEASMLNIHKPACELWWISTNMSDFPLEFSYKHYNRRR